MQWCDKCETVFRVFFLNSDYLFLVRNIYTFIVSTTLQYTFPVWQCMIRLRICAHCSLCHIRCFGINMTSMCHPCIFICFIYVVFFFTRPSVLSILALSFSFSNTYHARIAIINVYSYQKCNIRNHTLPCTMMKFF